MEKRRQEAGAIDSCSSVYWGSRSESRKAIGLVVYHAYLVYDAKNNFYMASNPVPLTLVK